jgi:hypothetical protein
MIGYFSFDDTFLSLASLAVFGQYRELAGI